MAAARTAARQHVYRGCPYAVGRQQAPCRRQTSSGQTCLDSCTQAPRSPARPSRRVSPETLLIAASTPPRRLSPKKAEAHALRRLAGLLNPAPVARQDYLLCFVKALPNMLCLMRVGVLQSRQARIGLLQPAHPHIAKRYGLGRTTHAEIPKRPARFRNTTTAMDTVVTPLKEFGKNSVRLVKRCTKPDRRGAHGPTGSC